MRYFLDIHDGTSVTEDVDGHDYDCDASAREAALDAARSLMAASAMKGRCRRHWRFDVRDAGRSSLFQVPFDQALVPDRLPGRPA